jgi:hypothetical protein
MLIIDDIYWAEIKMKTYNISSSAHDASAKYLARSSFAAIQRERSGAAYPLIRSISKTIVWSSAKAAALIVISILHSLRESETIEIGLTMVDTSSPQSNCASVV